MQVKVETLKAMKKQGLNIIVIQAIAAVLILILPNFLPNGFIKIVGILAIIFGAALFYLTMKKPKDLTSWKSYLMPIIIIAVGLFVFIYTGMTLTIIAWAIGAVAILKGIGTVFLNESPVQNPRYKIFGLVSIVIGLSIILLADNIGVYFSYYIAAILIYHVIIDFIIYRDLEKFIDAAGSSDSIEITR